MAGALLLSLLAIMALAAPIAAAHEGTAVGPYSLSVGWQVEPPSATHANGIEVRVTATATGEPVEGLSGQLRATIRGGGASLTQLLLTDPVRSGVYIAPLTPTVPGSYLVDVQGNISTTAVDLRDIEIEEVAPASAGEVPPTHGPGPELATLRRDLAASNEQLAALEAQLQIVRALAVGASLVAVLAIALALRPRYDGTGREDPAPQAERKEPGEP